MPLITDIVGWALPTKYSHSRLIAVGSGHPPKTAVYTSLKFWNVFMTVS